MTEEIVKGFRDFVGEDARKLAEIKKIIIENFEKYNFEPAETPIVEYEDFVKSGNPQDEAVSDIFKLEDKGKRKLALRYEFTFQLKRLMKNKKMPYRRYQIGPVFRDEPVSRNRLRQFTQCDADIVGSAIKDEAEILAMTGEILNELNIKPIILVNSRKLLNEILESQGVQKKFWEFVLREIDKYGKIPESEIIANLKKYKAEKIISLLKQGEKFFKKFDSYGEILKLMKYCRYYGVKILFSPTIVRGLSYYNGTVFEIKAKGIRETIVAGGSYFFNNIQCTGISFGLERLSLIAGVKKEKEEFIVISLNKDEEAIKLARQLREKGKSCMIYYGKPSKALEYANAYSIQNAVFIGEKEIKSKKFKVKDLKSGKESILKI